MDLAKLRVDEPCAAEWSEMTGDERARHCASCKKTVHDLTQMTEAEVGELMERSGKGPCVRFLPDETGAPIFKGSAAWLKLAAVGAFITVTASGCSPDLAFVDSHAGPVAQSIENLNGSYREIDQVPFENLMLQPTLGQSRYDGFTMGFVSNRVASEDLPMIPEFISSGQPELQ